MKRNKMIASSLALWIMLGLMLTIVITIILMNMLWQDATAWKKLAMDLMNSLLSAVTVGLIIGTFTKIISERLAFAKMNDRKLASFGISSISTGVSTTKDSLDLFGNTYTKHYPKEICLLFITGNVFFKSFERELINCIQCGTRIKVLVASPEDSNADFLERMEQLCPQESPYKEQVLRETLPAIEEIRKKAGSAEGEILVRFYQDEYRYNFRISKYIFGEDEIYSNYWVNVQPPKLDAVKLSVVLKGSVSSDDSNERSFFKRIDESFTYLWDKYQSTER